MQLVSCIAAPEHRLPPFNGAGLLHALERLLVPRPQRALHSDQGDHGPQPPFTVNEKKKIEH